MVGVVDLSNFANHGGLWQRSVISTLTGSPICVQTMTDECMECYRMLKMEGAVVGGGAEVGIRGQPFAVEDGADDPGGSRCHCSVRIALRDGVPLAVHALGVVR